MTVESALIGFLAPIFDQLKLYTSLGYVFLRYKYNFKTPSDSIGICCEPVISNVSFIRTSGFHELFKRLPIHDLDLTECSAET